MKLYGKPYNRKEVEPLPMKYDYSYLRGFILEHFGNNANFARFLGIGTTALYARLASKTPFTQAEIDMVARSAAGRLLTPNEINRLFFTHKIRKSV